MTRIALRRRVDAHRAKNCDVIDRRGMRQGRGEIDHAENRAISRRRHADRRLRAIRPAGRVHRKFACHPKQGDAVGAAFLRPDRIVKQHNRLADRIMAGHDSPRQSHVHSGPPN